MKDTELRETGVFLLWLQRKEEERWFYKSKLKGIFISMVTPTDSEDRVDKAATRRLVKYLIEGGVEGLVPL